jgi:hypothetical protein
VKYASNVRLVFDLEADGLLPEATVIHCCSFKDIDTQQLLTFSSKDDILSRLLGADLLIGFNVLGYDIPLVEKLYGVDLKHLTTLERTFDLWECAVTLNPNRQNSVEAWSQRLGMDGKIKIDDWKGLPLETYIARSEQDVEIEYRIYLALLQELGIKDYRELFNE